MSHDALWHLNHDMPIMEDYGLGTELNKAVTDITGILADQVLNRADVAGIIASYNAAGNCVIYSSAGATWSVGTGDLTLKVAGSFVYTIAGAAYKKATTDNIALSGATALTCAGSSWVVYGITATAGGTIGLRKGTDGSDEAGAWAGVTAIAPLATEAIVGLILVDNSTTSTAFTPGATGAGLGDFEDDTNAQTYLSPISGIQCQFPSILFGAALSQTDIVAYTQTFNAIT